MRNDDTGVTGRSARISFYLGVLFTPLPALNVIGDISVGDTFLMLSGLLAAFYQLGTRQEAVRTSWWATAGWLVLMGLALSGLLADSIAGHFAFSMRIVFSWLAIIWISRTILQRRAHINHAVNAFVIGATITSLAAAAQLAGVSIGTTTIVQGRTFGLNVHPNGQGAVLAISLGYIIARLAFGWPAVRSQLGLILAGVICVGGLILSGSVTGMLSAAFAVGVLVIRRGVRPISWIVGSAVAFIIFRWLIVYQTSFGGTSPLERFRLSTGTSSVVGAQSTFASRIDTISYAINQIWTNPIAVLLGNGLDTGSLVSYNGETATHNIELLILMQGGLALLAAFAAIAFLAFRGLLTRRGDPLQEAALAGLFAASVMAQTGPVFVDRYFWIAVSLAIVLKRIEVFSQPVTRSDRQQHSSLPVPLEVVKNK